MAEHSGLRTLSQAEGRPWAARSPTRPSHRPGTCTGDLFVPASRKVSRCLSTPLKAQPLPGVRRKCARACEKWRERGRIRCPWALAHVAGAAQVITPGGLWVPRSYSADSCVWHRCAQGGGEAGEHSSFVPAGCVCTRKEIGFGESVRVARHCPSAWQSGRAQTSSRRGHERTFVPF